MDNEIILILTILICLFILSVIIGLFILSRRKERAVYNPSAAPEPFTGSFEDRLKALLDQMRVIEAVKLVRETKHIGLKESKDYINRFMRGEEPGGFVFEPTEKPAPPPEELDSKVFELLAKKKKIEAIKVVKESLDTGLKEAKDYVEEIERKLNM